MRRRQVGIGLAALLLFLAAAWLMSEGEPTVAPPRQVRFPTGPSADDRARAERRRVLPPAPPPRTSGAEGVPAAPPLPRDPFLAALPPLEEAKGLLVLEASAIRYSEIGELLLGCLSQSDRRSLDSVKETLGIDPLEDIDRVAFAGRAVLISGNFGALALPEGGARYGKSATIFERPGESYAVVGSELMILSNDPTSLRAAIDRAESPPSGPSPIAEGEAYGEAYGVLSAGAVEQLLKEAQPELATRMAGLTDRIQLHLTADQDLAFVLDVSGNDAERISELSRTAAGAIALWRMQAQAQGENEISELLDFAKVRPAGMDTRLELAVPVDWLRKQLGSCANPGGATPPGPDPVPAAPRASPSR